MNRAVKRLLLGLLAWAVPFIASVLVWDASGNGPRIPMEWFYALMAFTGAIGLAAALVLFFKGKVKNPVREGWVTGVTWYLELLLLDLIVLVGAFGMGLPEFLPMLLTYLNPLVVTVAVGYLK